MICVNVMSCQFDMTPWSNQITLSRGAQHASWTPYDAINSSTFNRMEMHVAPRKVATTRAARPSLLDKFLGQIE